MSEACRLGAESVVSTGDDLESQIRGEWVDGVDACLDTVGLGTEALVCVRDGGAFVTSVPTAVPKPVREIATRPCRSSPTPKRRPSWRVAPRRVS